MRPLPPGPAWLAAALLAAACTLVNQQPPNAPPTYTRSSISAYQARPGDRLTLVVVGVDEDYDPLFFAWEAYRLADAALDEVQTLTSGGVIRGPAPLRRLYELLAQGQAAGGFAAPAAQTTNYWSAPTPAQGAPERFLLVVAVRDRDCSAIVVPAEQTACTSGESQFVRVFTVTVKAA